MGAFITGGTGFIGKRLVRRLIERGDEPITVLVRKPSPELAASLNAFWGAADGRVTFVAGDIAQPGLGVAAKDAARLKGKVDHFFHLAAVYDLKADPEQVAEANVAGISNALAFAKSVKAGCFHHVSSIAAAGLYNGVFREDMFEEAQGLKHPYFCVQAQGRGPGAGGDGNPVAHLPAGHRRGRLADRRDGQDRRPLLLLQTDPEAARHAAVLDPDDRPRRRADQHRAGRLRRGGD